MNEGNLIPLNKRTKSEQREITQKGGKASGVARGFRAAAFAYAVKGGRVPPLRAARTSPLTVLIFLYERG